MASCLFPIVVKKYAKNPVNPDIKYHIGYMQVPCGNCLHCRRRKQNEWAFRCMAEAKYNKKSFFCTFTFKDEHLHYSPSGIPTLSKEFITSWIKQFRDVMPKLRFFGCGEYGDRFSRPHYHLAFFFEDDISSEYFIKRLKSYWKYGFCDVEEGITPGRAKYIAKYSMKQLGFDYKDCEPPFALMSRRPGIGKALLNDLPIETIKKLDQWVLHDEQGTPYPIPRLYRERIYNDSEREQHNLLLERLNNVKFESDLRLFYADNPDSNYFKSYADIVKSIDNKFRMNLHRERYEFRYKSYQEQYKPFKFQQCDFGLQPNYEFDSDIQIIYEQTPKSYVFDAWFEDTDFE